ncbi:MAG: PepSY domain-containing protein [Gemmatimonadaceae bacterium]
MIRSLLIPLASAFALTIGALYSAQDQASKPMKEEKPGLLAQAKISADVARATALGRIKSGAIRDEEIEVEDGKLVYSFDIKIAGKSGIEEVLIDAKTGAIVSVEHETPKAEAAEARKEKKLKVPAKRPLS